ncbi:hydrolase [Alcanivorax sp. S71-1-4]|uniref:alpha/beta fold hydrolase n=1 Tax=Alcanivorax sp. S71-1-4 TaxID=1177159 RepID=UPI00135AC579|nr:alpha/beta hydrolase [Alcanivorax sp. S71-1-4]KAF0810485.1 hydrolase [Alcanivorax sp. S71-1-4]
MNETWVLLRGLVREARHWEGFPDMLRASRPGASVETLDLPGNGALYLSDSPTSVSDMVDALRAQLGSRGLKPPYHVMALSLGGMVALNWLQRFPGEVAAAVLINTSAAGFNPFWQRLRPANYGPLLRFALYGRDIYAREHTILRLTTNMVPSAEMSAVASRWAAYAASHPTSRRNALRQLWAAIRFRAPAHLPGTTPVLLVNGAADTLVHPLCSVTLAGAWRCPLRVHPHAGHDLPLDAPRWLAETALNWVDGLASHRQADVTDPALAN